MEYHCPLCGAMIAEGSAMCRVCKAGVRWQGGRPTPALESKLGNLLWELAFALILSAALMLLTHWLLRWRL